MTTGKGESLVGGEGRSPGNLNEKGKEVKVF